MERITQKLKLCFLIMTLQMISSISSTKNVPQASENSWVGSKYQIECTMCSACDNPCGTSPPPPSPSPPPPSYPSPPPPSPSGPNCPPPPTPPTPSGGYYYSPPPPPPSTYSYSPPSGYYYPPPYKNYPTPPPPNPIVPYFPYYFHIPPPPMAGSVRISNSVVLTITLFFSFLCL